MSLWRAARRWAQRRVSLIVAPLLLLCLSIPVGVHAVADLSRNPQATLANNFNDLQDLARLRAGRAATTRPAITSGSDTVSGTVTDATSGNPVSGATVYLSDVPQPCNNTIAAGPCAAAMQTATTGAGGTYQFSGIGNGTYNLAVSRLSAGSTLYPQTAPGVVPASDTNQQGVRLSVAVNGNTTVNFSLQPFAAPGSRSIPGGHSRNLVIVDFDETYARGWFNDSNLAGFSGDVNTFANGGVNNQNGFATYGWSPVDHYSLATGQYPYWRLWDPWPNNLCNWRVSGNGGSDCGIDTNMFYCSGSCVPEEWGQMSMFDVAKAYGMSTAVIGGSDYPTGHITNANVDSIQLGANSQCPSAGASCQWETEAKNWITGTGGPNPNGFLLYFPITPAEGSTPEFTSPDASGSSYQQAQQLDDQIFADFKTWLSGQGYLSNTDIVVVADEAENDGSSFDNFYGTNSTKNVPTAFGGPDYQSGLHPTTLIHLDDVAATALGGLCLPPPAGDRGTVQQSYLRASCPSGGPTSTPTNTPPPASTPTNTPVPANSPTITPTNTPTSGGGNCSTYNGSQYCLTGLTASATNVAAGVAVTLTASASPDVGPSPYYIDIANESGTVVATGCGSGTTCSVSVSSANAASHTYTAYLSTSSSGVSSGAAHSGPVTVTWGGAAPTSTPTNTPVVANSPTNTPSRTPTNTPVPANSPTSTPTNTPTAGGGNCSTYSGTQYCLTGLSASATSVAAGAAVTLTASASPDVGPSPWYLDIADQAGTVVHSCGTGITCSTTVSSAATSRTYTAYLSTSSTSIATTVASSNSVTVTWGGAAPTSTPTNTPVSAASPTNTPTRTPTSTPTSGGNCSTYNSTQYCLTGLSASATSVAAGAAVTLTASTNADVGPSPYYIDIANESGIVVATGCGSGTTCSVSVSSANAASHTYTAYLSTSSSGVSSGAAHSGPVTVTWGGAPPTSTPTSGANCSTYSGTQYCLTGLSASATSVAVGTAVTLTASTNADVGPSPWYIDIANESGTVVATGCGSGTTCSTTVSSSVAASHTYTAYLSTSSSGLSSGAAHSGPVTVTW